MTVADMKKVKLEDLILTVDKQIKIDADVETVWEAMLEQITSGMDQHNNSPMNMKLEARPGGRYFRDLGNDAGHLWGHVQVIKPPKLLEITGPLFVSAPSVSHVQYKIIAEGNGSMLQILHRGFGFVPKDQLDSIDKGWQMEIDQIKDAAESR